jgi:hypothetical protein
MWIARKRANRVEDCADDEVLRHSRDSRTKTRVSRPLARRAPLPAPPRACATR